MTDINLKTEEGDLLGCAIGMITSHIEEYYQKPDVVLKKLIQARNERIKFANNMYSMKNELIYGKKNSQNN